MNLRTGASGPPFDRFLPSTFMKLIVAPFIRNGVRISWMMDDINSHLLDIIAV